MCTIKLQADDGTYVVAEVNNGQTGLYAKGISESEAIELEVVKTGGHTTTDPTRIVFKNSNDYVTLHQASDGIVVVLDPTGEINNRKFEVFWLGCNKIALKGKNGKYVSRETLGSNKLQANRDVIGSWETFTVIEVS